MKSGLLFIFHVSFLSSCGPQPIVMLHGDRSPDSLCSLSLTYKKFPRSTDHIGVANNSRSKLLPPKMQKVHTIPTGLQSNAFCCSLNSTRTRKPWALVSSILLTAILSTFCTELRAWECLCMDSARSAAPVENCKKPQMKLLTPKLCWILQQSKFCHHLTVWSMHRVCVCFQSGNQWSK